jgi:hypothetical protein
MSRLLCLFLCVVCVSYGIDYSLRIRALGTDFVNLIPDYETDLYLNPNLLGSKKLAGVSYQPGLDAPVTLRVLTKRFGWTGQYWGKYSEDKIANAIPRNVTSLHVNDFWMFDMRGKLPKFLADDVWSLYNDGIYNSVRIQYSENLFDTTRTIKYLISANGSHKIGEYISVVTKVCGGIYFSYRNMRYYGSEEESYEKWLFLYTGNIGFYYRNTNAANRFTSFYCVFGGPISTSGIDRLPYSIFEHLSDDIGFQYSFFARTLVTKIGFAKGIPINDQSLFTFGVRDTLLLQRTYMADTSVNMRGLRNFLSVPVAIEYSINKITFRIGTRVFYSYYGDKQWDSDSTLTRYNEHILNWGYTFGLQWKLSDHLLFDFYNDSHLNEIDDWSIYLKYVP